ncbi:MAG: 50S ribosomal protein L6 [Candidatus Aenigmatarchaeota archaeon]|nr:MAG: 50S ribosomal protein L6 [Candidatus Aenigmarchaeota archaeon]
MEATIEVPEDVTAVMEGANVRVKGPKGELSRSFRSPLVSVALHDGAFRITSRDERRATRALVGTWRAHLRNMFTGVTAGYEKKMKIIHVHFPMSVKIEGARVAVQNLLGQKSPRYARIETGVEANIEGDEISVKGTSKDAVGQTVSNIETATKLANRRDRRRFYDGVYLVKAK